MNQSVHPSQDPFSRIVAHYMPRSSETLPGDEENIVAALTGPYAAAVILSLENATGRLLRKKQEHITELTIGKLRCRFELCIDQESYR
jgi:hypothetical protein